MWKGFLGGGGQLEGGRGSKMKDTNFQNPMQLLVLPPHFGQFLIILKIFLIYLGNWSYIKQE